MRVSLDDLKPGMTLAADLQEPGGRLLLPAATILTDRHCAISRCEEQRSRDRKRWIGDRDPRPGEPGLRYHVVDSGLGIPESKRALIFQ